MINMILVFDLSGVFFNDGLKVAVKRISDEFKLNPEIVEFVLNGSFAQKYRTGLIETEEFWKQAKDYLKVDDIKEIKKIFFESYHPHEESVQLLKSLKNKKIKTAFLSNSPKDRTEFLNKKYNFISLFDFGLFSFEAHAWKPDKEIYQKFLKKFNLNPNDVIYIDDRERDIKPAKELGMRIILFQNINQLKDELKKIGISV
ncbi:HAD family phosphatase [Candidatus Woesearchaeota archaeon]|nr:HAD family phosphatase [Candidatus Woesearchaeota archaeon]